MKSLAIATAAGILLAGASMAQTTNSTTAPPMAPADGSGRAAASGNPNPTVATTSANALSPAKGSTSFTMGEARSRIEKNGFSNVSDLVKDNDGIWRGKAQKSGSTASVWLDYKGNVGATN